MKISPIPKTAPFAEDEIDILNRVVGPASATQRAWLAGFLAGLDGVEFAVLALGDSAYAEFCAIGKAIDARLAELGAKRVVDRIDCDVDFADPAARWIDTTLKALAPPAEQRGTVIAVDFAGRQPSVPEID